MSAARRRAAAVLKRLTYVLDRTADRLDALRSAVFDGSTAVWEFAHRLTGEQVYDGGSILPPRRTLDDIVILDDPPRTPPTRRTLDDIVVVLDDPPRTPLTVQQLYEGVKVIDTGWIPESEPGFMNESEREEDERRG